MKTVLVVANQTVGGVKLFERVRERAAAGDVRFYLVVPRSRPPYGGVIYDEAVRDAAQARLELARQVMAREGIDVEGEVGDEDPFKATMDALAHSGAEEIVISTLPRTASGWLRRDLIERVERESGLPVEHIESDLNDGLPVAVTLVLANQTVAEPSLTERLEAKGREGGDGEARDRVYIVVVPQGSGDGRAAETARERLRHTCEALRDAGLACTGMIGDPDPYTAAMNALSALRVDDIVVSTLEPERSRWLRSGLVDRLRSETGKPIEHVVAGAPATQAVEA